MKYKSFVLMGLSAMLIFIGGCSEKKDSAEPLKTNSANFIPSEFIPLPSWNAETNLIKVTSKKGLVEVIGDDSNLGYQVSTPPVDLAKQINVSLKMNLEIKTGRICVGVLSENRQSWVLSPSDVQSSMVFNTGENKFIYVVLANCNNSQSGNKKSRFVINSASLGLAQSVAK